MRYKPSVFNISVPMGDQHAVYNTFSRSVVIFDEPFHQFLVHANEEEQRLLFKQGILVNEEENEINKVLTIRRGIMYDPHPDTFYIEVSVTMKCQAKCKYCFENGVRSKPEMSEATADATKEFVLKRIETNHPGKVHVAFFGGEPMLNLDAMLLIGRELKRECQSKGIEFETEITTNGIAFTREKAKVLVEDCNLKKAQITLDGLREDYRAAKGIDAFDTVVKNIEDASDLLKVVVRINVSKQNYEGIRELLHYLGERRHLRDKITVYIAQVDAIGKHECGEDLFEEAGKYSNEKIELYRELSGQYEMMYKDQLLPFYRGRFCVMENVNSFSVFPDGRLFKCNTLYGNDECCCGDVFEGSRYAQHEMDFYMDVDERCIRKQCPALPVCFGGCPAKRLSEGVRIDCEEKIDTIIKEAREGIKLLYL